MNTIKRTLLQKLKILLFHKDVRVTQGGVYSEVRSFDFSSYYPESDYIQYSEPPLENVYDIRDFGARAGDEGFDCAPGNKRCDQSCLRNRRYGACAGWGIYFF